MDWHPIQWGVEIHQVALIMLTLELRAGLESLWIEDTVCFYPVALKATESYSFVLHQFHIVLTIVKKSEKTMTIKKNKNSRFSTFQVLTYFDFVFTAVFAMEVLVKVIVLAL